jgi:hypothetical protein
MAELKDEHEQRLARLEHMIEELRVQTKECMRLTTEARVAAKANKEKSQRDRAARRRTGSKRRPPASPRRSG